MALRNQPYLPLYVDDFMVDEKLRECSAESTGVYVRLMCLMHKNKEYGVILLKQNDKQKSSSIQNFACKLVKHLPWDSDVIERGLGELIENDVIQLDGDKLSQKRMIRDNYISELRSRAGKKGGKITQNFAKAKSEANPVNESVSENINTTINKGGMGGNFKPPTLDEITVYCQSRKNNINPKAFFDYFTESGWIDSNGNPVKSWKSKLITWENLSKNKGSPKKTDYAQRTYTAEHFEKDREESIKEMEEWYNAQEKDENGDAI